MNSYIDFFKNYKDTYAPDGEEFNGAGLQSEFLRVFNDMSNLNIDLYDDSNEYSMKIRAMREVAWEHNMLLLLPALLN